jgi:hypothetical protein
MAENIYCMYKYVLFLSGMFCNVGCTMWTRIRLTWIMNEKDECGLDSSGSGKESMVGLAKTIIDVPGLIICGEFIY